MKKTIYLCAALCAVMAMTSCKSSESAYKKAYEKAKQQELAEAELNKDTDVTVIETTEPEQVTTPVQQPASTAPAPADRQEKVEVVGDGTLNKYSVVCGSFGLKTNAESLRDQMVKAGYNALVVFNPEIAMYRVITATFPTREEATASREELKRKYPERKDFQGAWLLIKAE